jgi:Ataxin-3
MRLNEGSGNVDPSGNFSIEVLRSALITQYNLSLPNIRQEKVMDGKDVTDVEGFICNREAHWFAIRKINGRFWNLNSTLEKPTLISHFGLATEIQGLQNQGYSVFCISDGLPAECYTKAGRSRGLPQYWWKESDLVAGKSNAITGATDPWKTVGSGMRLDGRAGATIAMERMTEEQMMQMAMMASFVPEATPEPPGKLIDVPPEPAPDAAGVATVQFRMQNGNRVLRRFLNSESVAVVFAFVAQSCPGQMLELKYGFPPKDLAVFKDKTIGEANLNGENIQARQC